MDGACWLHVCCRHSTIYSMNVRIFWVHVMEWMCVKRWGLGLYSHLKEFLGNRIRMHANSKGKIPSTEKILSKGSSPWRCIKQDSEPNTLPTSYSGPLTFETWPLTKGPLTLQGLKQNRALPYPMSLWEFYIHTHKKTTDLLFIFVHSSDSVRSTKLTSLKSSDLTSIASGRTMPASTSCWRTLQSPKMYLKSHHVTRVSFIHNAGMETAPKKAWKSPRSANMPSIHPPSPLICGLHRSGTSAISVWDGCLRTNWPVELIRDFSSGRNICCHKTSQRKLEICKLSNWLWKCRQKLALLKYNITVPPCFHSWMTYSFY